MNTKLNELMQDPEFRKEFAVEGFIAETAQVIWELMEQRGLKQADLARLLNKTPAFVSQLLNGKANMTVRTLAEVLYALDAKAILKTEVECEPAQEETDSETRRTFQFPESYIKSWAHPKGNTMRFGKIEGGRVHSVSSSSSSEQTLNSECVA